MGRAPGQRCVTVPGMAMGKAEVAAGRLLLTARGKSPGAGAASHRNATQQRLLEIGSWWAEHGGSSS